MADEGLDRIKIELGWLSGQDSQAFQEMKNVVQESAKLMSAFNAKDFVEAATKIKELSDTIKENMQSVKETEFHERGQPARGGVLGWVGRTLGTTGGAGDPIAGAQAERERTEASRQDRDLEEKRDREKLRAEQEDRKANEAERLRLESLSSDQHAADRLRARYQLPRIGSAEDDPGAWYNKS